MEYPKYNHKKENSMKRMALLAVLTTFAMCFVLPWLIYILGSVCFVLVSTYVIKKSQGFKRICGLFVSIMMMLMVFDFADHSFTWSLNYVLPSFLIFIMISFMITVYVRKKTWHNNYDTHMYILMMNALMTVLMFIGIITFVPLVVITLSFAIATMVLIRFKVGNKYERNIIKFMHI